MDKTYDVLKDIFKILPERIVHLISKLPSQMVSSLLMVVIEWVFPVQVSILKVTYLM